LAVRLVDSVLQRFIPGVAIVLATAAFVVTVGGSDPGAPPESPLTAERFASLEKKLKALSAKLDAIDARLAKSKEPVHPEPTRPAAEKEAEDRAELRSPKPLSEDASWPVNARRLTSDLGLDSSQIDALDRSLEECARGLEALRKEDDKKRAEALGRLARRRAYRSVERALNGEQKKLLARLVRDPKCPGLRRWFMYNKPCGGCGKKKTKKAKPAGKAGSTS